MIIRLLLILTILLTPFSNLHAADGVSIGIVVPLSGKFAAFGNKALQGAELAIQRYNSTEAGKKRPVRLLIKDSQGTPKAAEKAVVELNADGVDLIIGPIMANTSDAAAKKAQELNIPIITMTQKEGITDIGGWVFRNCMTNAAEVKGLVGYASSHGVKKVAILYPDNQFGRELTVVFSTEMVRLGGEVVAYKDYKEGQTDFGPEIKELVGSEFLEKMKVYTEEKEREFKEAEKSKTKSKTKTEIEIETIEESKRPAPGFDALFIPDYADRVGLIVPQLAFYDVRDVRLLGASGWSSPKLIKMAGGFLSDAVIVDGFFSGSSKPHVINFVNAYKNTFGEEPGVLEAQAFDTAEIVLSAISGGDVSRYGLRDSILKIKGHQGVSGDITFKERDAERSYFYLTVNGGVLEEIADH